MFLRRGGDRYQLVIGMTGVSMGDRLAYIGCPSGDRLAAVALKVGLSGHAAAIVPDEGAAARVRKGAARAGALVEVEIAPPTRLPIADAAFDLAVIDDAGGVITALGSDDRAAAVREIARVLRPGGRAIVIGGVRPRGLGALFARTPPEASVDLAPALQAEGFRSVRYLAEREGLSFTEGIKPR